MTRKQCKRCKTSYEISDGDYEYFKKIAPQLNKSYPVDPPQLCFDCRMTTLMAWRNERNFHAIDCAACGKKTVSIFSPEEKLQILCSDCFWSDQNDQIASGQDFNPNKPFFEQFDTLMHKAKLLALYAVHNENCEYVNQESDDNNCYLCMGGYNNQDSYYQTYSSYADRCINCAGVTNSQNLANCTFAINCYEGQYLYDCHNCKYCYFCQDCIGCEHCFGCINLRYKKYYFFNEQLDKDSYFQKIAEYLDTYKGIKNAEERFAQHRLKYVYKYDIRVFCGDNCNGDLLFQCKNVENTFYSANCEDCKNSYLVNKITDVMDGLAVGRGELVYYSGSSISLFGSAFCASCYMSRNIYYCFMCYNSHDLFGCIGLNHKQYCIFNKQYSKEEYEELLPKVIKHMQETGEWGEFFPIEMSPFGYNESMAIEYYPKSKSEAQKIKANWREDAGEKYKREYYQPKDIGEYRFDKNPDAEQEITKCLAGVLKCEESGRPFKIMAPELAQYIERNIQLPRQHPNIRYKHRLELLNKMKLYDRQCMCKEEKHGHSGQCEVKFKTTYAPERPEKVYCEECYQKTVL
jgi:CxxC-x17-CxxC domain-containing protein